MTALEAKEYGIIDEVIEKQINLSEVSHNVKI